MANPWSIKSPGKNDDLSRADSDGSFYCQSLEVQKNADVHGNLTVQGSITGGGIPSVPVSIANGGTGQTTASAAIQALTASGLILVAGSTLSGGAAGMDTAFTDILRVYNGQTTGSIQLVAPNGGIDVYAGGNEVAVFSSTGLNMGTYAVNNIANGSASTDAAAFGQIPTSFGTGATTSIAPKVATLTDASTVVINASLGNDFVLLTTSGIGATRQLGAPSNPVDGQRVIFRVQQAASGGPYALTYNAAFSFSTGLPSPTLSTTASAIDLLGFIYNGTKSKWLFVAFQGGF